MASAAPYRLDRPAARAPSPGMIAAIVRFADQRTDMGGGKVLLRLSAGRLAQAEVLLALGLDVSRASEIGVVWNEREDEFVRIVDDTRVQPQQRSWWEDYFDRFDAIEEAPAQAHARAA